MERGDPPSPLATGFHLFSSASPHQCFFPGTSFRSLDQRADPITEQGEASTAERGARDGSVGGLASGDSHLAALPWSPQASLGGLWLLELLEVSDLQAGRRALGLPQAAGQSQQRWLFSLPLCI